MFSEVKKEKESKNMPSGAKESERKLLNYWRDKLKPENFNQKRGAHYHTAPTVVSTDEIDYPERLSKKKGTVTVIFRINAEDFFSEPEKMFVKKVEFVEGKPATKDAKNGPIFVLTKDVAIAVIPQKENFYWTAKVLSTHKIVAMKISPDKKRTDGKRREVSFTVTFVPNDDESPN